MSFSDQWPDRVTHYRIASDSKGEFIIPQKDHFDGNGFYAGRIEKDLEHLYIFGWTPTKVMYSCLLYTSPCLVMQFKGLVCHYIY